MEDLEKLKRAFLAQEKSLAILSIRVAVLEKILVDKKLITTDDLLAVTKLTTERFNDLLNEQVEGIKTSSKVNN
jgi:hypothetical protein